MQTTFGLMTIVYNTQTYNENLGKCRIGSRILLLIALKIPYSVVKTFR